MKRAAKKTKVVTKFHPTVGAKDASLQWLYGDDLSDVDPKLLHGFSAAFRKVYQVDFYITKYQGKVWRLRPPCSD